ncbi:Heat-labile enterotoxin, A chain [Metarhizium rileyi]|uniref:Heat-labile enterotoxin, A chain n=1 Tax=Metarhizium rileyi (strain RCEF 4871) TaxID=1649241 RepID=A0A166WRW7_METRR|nr:Heat-labile enterotoxin, A chain [Metarhizium rileyi RCEF 4871]
MLSRWTLLVLSCISLLLWPNAAFAEVDGAAAKEQPFDLFRGDSRPPNVLKAEGGFLPSLNPVPARLYSLIRHMGYRKGQYGRTITPYISTTKYLETAIQYAQYSASSATGSTYVYRISPTPHIFDTSQSVSLEIHKGMSKGVYDALGGILWQQVRGYYEIPLGASKEVMREILADPEKIYQPNPQYDTRFDEYRTSSGQPQLYVKSKEAYENAKEFMSRPGVGDVVGWQGDFPLFQEPLHEQKAVKEEEAYEEAMEAATQAKSASKETIKALKAIQKTNNVATALAEVNKASEAAKVSIAGAKKEAKKRSERAREAVAQAIQEANRKAARSYFEEAKSLDKAQTLESARKAIEKVRQIADLKTTLKTKMSEMISTIDKVHQAIREEKESRPARISYNVQENIPSEDNVWALNREFYFEALPNELKVLQYGFDKMRDTMEFLSKLEAKAEAATETSRKILEKEKATAQEEVSDTSAEAATVQDQASTAPATNAALPNAVFYGDVLWPEEAKKQGGFHATADTMKNPKTAAFTLQAFADSDKFKRNMQSYFVKAHQTFGEAAEEAAAKTAELSKGFDPVVYTVHATPNMVKVGKEIAVAGGIVWPQVMAWTQVPRDYAMPSDGVKGKEELREHFDKAYQAKPERFLQKNEDYDAKFNEYTINDSAEDQKSLMSSEQPRKTFTDFMTKHGASVGFKGKLPLLEASKAVTSKASVAAKERSHAVAVALLPAVLAANLIPGLGEIADAAEIAALTSEAVETTEVLAETGSIVAEKAAAVEAPAVEVPAVEAPAVEVPAMEDNALTLESSGTAETTPLDEESEARAVEEQLSQAPEPPQGMVKDALSKSSKTKSLRLPGRPQRVKEPALTG